MLLSTDELAVISHPKKNRSAKMLSICAFPDVEQVKKILNEYDFLLNVFEETYLVNSQSSFNYQKHIPSGRVFHFPLFHHKHLRNWQSVQFYLSAISFIHQNRNSKIMIHCRSGMHRSKMVVDGYHFLVHEKHNQDGVNMLLENCIDMYSGNGRKNTSD